MDEENHNPSRPDKLIMRQYATICYNKYNNLRYEIYYHIIMWCIDSCEPYLSIIYKIEDVYFKLNI